MTALPPFGLPKVFGGQKQTHGAAHILEDCLMLRRKNLLGTKQHLISAICFRATQNSPAELSKRPKSDHPTIILLRRLLAKLKRPRFFESVASRG